MMRKRNFVLLITLVLLLTALAPAASARAENDDFSMTYDFYPGGVGHLGGYVRLVLLVKNEGTKNIDKVDVVINLKAGFSKHWTGTIAPGEEKKIVFDNIHFTPDDVNIQRILQVAINNDGDANPDGIQMYRFAMGGAREWELWSYVLTISPDRSTLHPGDTMRCEYAITNISRSDGMIIEHLNVAVTIDLDGTEDHYMPVRDLGSLNPGETATHSFSYTLTEDDITDRLRVVCNIKCALAGANYGMDYYSVSFSVEEAVRPTERPTERATATHTATPVPRTPIPTVTPTPTESTAMPTPTAMESPAPTLPPAASLSPAPPDTAVQAQASQDMLTTVLMVIIGTLLLAVVVLLVVLLLRRKKTKQ